MLQNVVYSWIAEWACWANVIKAEVSTFLIYWVKSWFIWVNPSGLKTRPPFNWIFSSKAWLKVVENNQVTMKVKIARSQSRRDMLTGSKLLSNSLLTIYPKSVIDVTGKRGVDGLVKISMLVIILYLILDNSFGRRGERKG